MSDALRSLLSRRVHLGEDKPFREWGDLVLHISVFDHRLTEEEAASNPTMFYRLAVEQDNLQPYLEGEQRWLSFYRELASEGACVIDGRRKSTLRLPASSGRLSRLVKDSVRERRLMDAIFNRFPTRVLGGYDRTDTFLPATRQERVHVADLALSHGLHVLD